jgi:hypothetical protein
MIIRKVLSWVVILEASYTVHILGHSIQKAVLLFLGLECTQKSGMPDPVDTSMGLGRK